MKIEINDKVYNVKVAQTDEEKMQGLRGVTELADDEGMLFIYDEPNDVAYTTEGMLIDIDIIFIDDDEEVISIFHGKANTNVTVEEDDVKYVLEIKPGNDIQEGDDVDIDDDEEDSTMYILDNKGNIQGEIKEGSRIFSRINTRTLIKLSKKANKSKEDKDYKKLGKRLFQFLDVQDNRKPEYVEIPK